MQRLVSAALPGYRVIVSAQEIGLQGALLVIPPPGAAPRFLSLADALRLSLQDKGLQLDAVRSVVRAAADALHQLAPSGGSGEAGSSSSGEAAATAATAISLLQAVQATLTPSDWMSGEGAQACMLLCSACCCALCSNSALVAY